MKLLGLSGAGSRIAMSLGRSRVDLESFDHPGRPYPGDATACDLVFQHLALVTDDAEAAWRRARDAGAAPISRAGPVTLPKSAGGVTAVKFRDPEGHPLEFLQFPQGANPDWKGAGVMGIDHSAISVSDVAASRRFYARRGLSEARCDGQSRPDAGRARRARRRRGRCRADEPCRQAAASRNARLSPSRRPHDLRRWPPTISPPPASSGGRMATR